MMGVGKSTIGKILAKKLKLKFIDIDKLIEKKENSTIKEIFKNKGENYFRKVEKQITLEELKKRNLVIALGGGAFVNHSIRKEIKNSAISFWLDLNIKSIISRLINPSLIKVLTRPSTNSSTQDAPNLQSIPLSLACHARRSRLNLTQTSELDSRRDNPSLLTFILASCASNGIAAIEITMAPDNRA